MRRRRTPQIGARAAFRFAMRSLPCVAARYWCVVGVFASEPDVGDGGREAIRACTGACVTLHPVRITEK